MSTYLSSPQVLLFDVPGSIVESGCYTGKTSPFLQMLLDCFATDRSLYLSDPFQGLPRKGNPDIRFNTARKQ
jgi:hypothetical protein